jgi:hypothetical protein
MQYRQRLGTHQQKAQVQQRNNGQVKPRTAEAIANNREWVDHYEQVLSNLSK